MFRQSLLTSNTKRVYLWVTKYAVIAITYPTLQECARFVTSSQKYDTFHAFHFHEVTRRDFEINTTVISFHL